MKKIISIALILVLCLSFIGCSKKEEATNDISTKMPEETSDDNVEAVKEILESKKPTNSNLNPADLSIPDAIEYDVISWPVFGIATKIPIPTWSDRGCFYSSETSETMLWANIGYTTLDDYRGYVKALEDYGYNLNIHETKDYLFWGENEEGYGVQLTYVSWSRYMAIQVTSNAADWDVWWED